MHGAHHLHVDGPCSWCKFVVTIASITQGLYCKLYAYTSLLHRVRLQPSSNSSGNISGPLQYQYYGDGLWYNITYEGNYDNSISSHADTACRQLGCARGM